MGSDWALDHCSVVHNKRGRQPQGFSHPDGSSKTSPRDQKHFDPPVPGLANRCNIPRGKLARTVEHGPIDIHGNPLQCHQISKRVRQSRIIPRPTQLGIRTNIGPLRASERDPVSSKIPGKLSHQFPRTTPRHRSYRWWWGRNSRSSQQCRRWDGQGRWQGPCRPQSRGIDPRT